LKIYIIYTVATLKFCKLLSSYWSRSQYEVSKNYFFQGLVKGPDFIQASIGPYYAAHATKAEGFGVAQLAGGGNWEVEGAGQPPREACMGAMRGESRANLLPEELMDSRKG